MLDELNDSQRLAVEYNDGPSLVIAGAGSGKTRVLTYKIAYLIQQGMAPWNILALTFTNKAADEMKERIGRLVGEDKARYIWMGTFHSVFARILRQEAEQIGYKKDFTIYDETDSRSLIKSIVKEFDLDDKQYKPSSIHNRISMAKNRCYTAQAYTNDSDQQEYDRQARLPEISRIFFAYQHRCELSSAMDFDDLLLQTYLLFRTNENIRKKWAEKFQFILVDEYQDTNRVQQMIVEQLARENQKVCVVGDDAQSIYAFRGANIDNILDFNRVFAGSKLFKLEQNYRSTQRIVQAANSLIKHNQRRIDKNVFSENAEGEPLILKPSYSDREEASIVCKDIMNYCVREGMEYSDFAILYRTNAQSRPFEEECRRVGIPYRIYGGLSFYQRKEIKDIVAYFRMVVNPDDEEAFKRVINYPARGIGNTTVQKINECAQKSGVSLWEVCNNSDKYNLQLGAAAKKHVNEFVSLISEFVEKAATQDAYTIGTELFDRSKMKEDVYANNDPDDISRQENIVEFMAGLQDYVEAKREEGDENQTGLSGFLQEIALQTDKESDDGMAHKISMMTVHAAKGLEFPVVFIVGMEENIFPSQMSSTNLRELEEERRLFYVAITRAEKHCIVTCAKNRWRYGHQEVFVPSRFLQDIDSAYIRVYGAQEPRVETRNFGTYSPLAHRAERSETQSFRRLESPRFVPQNLRPVRNSVNPSICSSEVPAGLSVGTVIEHQRFGIGVVRKVDGEGENTKATVEFRNTGTKQLLLKFAKFTVIKS